MYIEEGCSRNPLSSHIYIFYHDGEVNYQNRRRRAACIHLRQDLIGTLTFCVFQDALADFSLLLSTQWPTNFISVWGNYCRSNRMLSYFYS